MICQEVTKWCLCDKEKEVERGYFLRDFFMNLDISETHGAENQHVTKSFPKSLIYN